MSSDNSCLSSTSPDSVQPDSVQLPTMTSPTCRPPLFVPECDSNNNSSVELKLPVDDLDLPNLDHLTPSIWSTQADSATLWSPTDLNLFSQTLTQLPRPTTLHRKPSCPDSSYDSDDADCDLLTKIVADIVDSESPPGDAKLPVKYEPISAILLSQPNPLHGEVNRTVSDTLAQEYPEWNIPKLANDLKELSIESKSLDSADDLDKVSFTSTDFEQPNPIQAQPIVTLKPEDLYDPEIAQLYEEKLKFAKKLGYTEDQVALAIAKIGYHVTKNDFLNELITIGNESSSTRIQNFENENRPPSVSNLQNPETGPSVSNSSDIREQPPLRPIVIDGSNVAISHGNQECFSSRGLQICIDWFRARGHREITAFVPMWRKQTGQRLDVPTKDRELLLQLESEHVLSFTPSKNISGRLITCYDDRYILNLALKNNGIIVSNDHFRDLVIESSDYKKVVDERQLMFIFVGDEFMPPDDPLGRDGPRLEQFLRMPESVVANTNQPCPYSIKCTYGKKCKFYHPGRLQNSIADNLRDKQKLSAQNSAPVMRNKKKGSLKPQNSLPLNLPSSKPGPASSGSKPKPKLSLCRTQSVAHPLLAPNAAQLSFDASVSKYLQASHHHQKLERQLSLNPFAPMFPRQGPSFPLANLSSSSSNIFVPSPSSNPRAPLPPPLPTRPKSKLAHTKSCGNPVNCIIDLSPFQLKPASKSSHNIHK